jgi:hypothetical protein
MDIPIDVSIPSDVLCLLSCGWIQVMNRQKAATVSSMHLLLLLALEFKVMMTMMIRDKNTRELFTNIVKSCQGLAKSGQSSNE